MAAGRSKPLLALLSAAVGLPGTMPAAHAVKAERTRVALQQLSYDEERERMQVRAPSVWIETPLSDTLDLELSATVDAVSGASPLAVSNFGGAPHQVFSGASIDEHRKEFDARLRRYFDDADIGAGLYTSQENDYRSDAISLEGNWQFNKKNTTVSIGAGYADDEIGATNQPALDEHSTRLSASVGLTQLLSRTAIVQTQLGHTRAKGYLADPYRSTLLVIPGAPPALLPDTRPDTRHQWAWTVRYRHHAPQLQGSLHADYRYYRDSWGVRSHTVEFAWYQQLTQRWTLRPTLRYYTQDDADFYLQDFSALPAGPVSTDYRLAAFGAVSAGLKVIGQLHDDVSVSLAVERYRQDPDYHAGGDGNSLSDLEADIVIVGVSARF